MDKKRIKIFVISPNDVKTERFIVKDVCEALNESAGGKIEIVPLIWEDRPLSYPKTPQESVDPLLEEADIYVVILWYRLGTPVEGCRGAISGEENVTGTQYEIEKILSMGKERIFFYLKTEKLSVDGDELKEVVKQKEMLESFIEKIGIGKKPVRHGYREFRTAEAFKTLIAKHLKAEIEEMTGEKIAIDKAAFCRNVIAYAAFFAILVSMAWGGYRLFMASEQTHTVTYRKQPIPNASKATRQNARAIRMSVKGDMQSDVRRLLLQTSQKAGRKVVSDSKNAAFELDVSFRSRENDYVIGGESMVQSVCTFAYEIRHLTEDSVVNTGLASAEAIDFDLRQAKRQCMQKAYDDISATLYDGLKGL